MIIDKCNAQAKAIEQCFGLISTHDRIIEEYRTQIYTLELNNRLLIKMLEEKCIMAKEEMATRWPLWMENDVGVIGSNGKMKGELQVHFYDTK